MSGYSDTKISYKGLSEDGVYQIYSKTLASTASSSSSHLNTYPGSFTQSKNRNMQLCVNSINRFLYKKSSKPLELMHTDVCGPAPIQLSIVLNNILYLLMISPSLLGFSC